MGPALVWLKGFSFFQIVSDGLIKGRVAPSLSAVVKVGGVDVKAALINGYLPWRLCARRSVTIGCWFLLPTRRADRHDSWDKSGLHPARF